MMKKTMHSRYWIGNSADSISDSDVSDTVRLMRLSGIRKGIANFVRIMTNRNIPVRFSSGEQSYTDGESVVVISASSNPNHFDSMVGLALHESSHIIYSDKLFYLYRMLTGDKFSSGWHDPKVNLNLVRLGMTWETFFIHYKFLLNFLEDRRIDAIMYKEVAGYRPYYEELYSRYFYAPMISVALKSPKFRTPTFASYEFHILNMMNPHADPDALPGLREIYDIVDLSNIGRYNAEMNEKRPFKRLSNKFDRSTYPMMAQDAYRVLSIIYENVQRSPEQDQNEMGESDNADPDNADPNDTSWPGAPEGNDLEDLDNLDHATNGLSDDEIEEVLTDADIDTIRKAQRRLVNGESRKSQLNTNDNHVMTELESADADLREAGDPIRGKCKVVVYRKLNTSIVESDTYPFGYNRYYGAAKGCVDSRTALADGIKMGNILVHRLRIMNDESTMKYSRQEHGHIDKRLLHQLGFGDKNVFSTEHTIRIKPVMVDISIDSSASMMGVKWRKSLTLAVALAYVADKTRSVRVRISVRTATCEDAAIGIIYDSKSDPFMKVKQLFPYIGPTGSTPEGLTFEAMLKELLEEVKNTRRYFINLSDGEPAHSYKSGGEFVYYAGEPAARHTAEQVRKMREAGIHILSYFVTEYDKATVESLNKNKNSLFHMMYGRDASYIGVENVTEVAQTLNALFLKE